MSRARASGRVRPGHGSEAREIVPLAPGYLRLIARIEALAGNASGADKSWVHRAHADAVRHFQAAKRR